MNIAKLNTAYDGGVILKAGSGGGNSGGGTSKPKYTGHADVEGLKAIGWTDEDIAYYQENGVNWNAEDDQYHLVSDDNKALYGVLNWSNIQTYKDRIVYLPKLSTSVPARSAFEGCSNLVGIPNITISGDDAYRMFYGCRKLTCIPLLNTSWITNMEYAFGNCMSLTTIPAFDTSKVTSMYYTFNQCYSLNSIPFLDISKVVNLTGAFNYCYSLTFVALSDAPKLQYASNAFYNCTSLNDLQINTPILTKNNRNYMFTGCVSMKDFKYKNIADDLSITDMHQLNKESLLFVINNEASTKAITIQIASLAYMRFANNNDVVAALTNHPNITLAT